MTDPEGIVMGTKFLGHELVCPLCDERLEVMATVLIKAVDVRVAGKRGFTHILNSSADTKVIGGGIDHQCKLKAVRDD